VGNIFYSSGELFAGRLCWGEPILALGLVKAPTDPAVVN
jgi:hypothetical protein